MLPPAIGVQRHIVWVSALSVLAFAACSKAPPPPRQISGQVFIVTRGGPSIKMALVEVCLYESKTLEDHFKSRGAEVAAINERMETIATDAQTEAFRAEAEKERSEKAARDAAGDTFFAAFLAEFRFRRVAAKEAREIADTAQAFIRVTQSGFPYFDQLPKPIASAKTDADGNFSITTLRTKTPLALLATTSRAVGAGDEVYFWAVRLPPDEESTKIALTNDNESGTTAPSSMLHTVALDSDATKALKLSPEELTSRLQKLRSTIAATNAFLSGPSSSPEPPQTQVGATPLPEFSPTPPPQFIRVTDWFTLTNTKGKEVKTLEPGKRLRVVSRQGDKITVDYLGESFSIPATVTEPSQ